MDIVSRVVIDSFPGAAEQDFVFEDALGKLAITSELMRGEPHRTGQASTRGIEAQDNVAQTFGVEPVDASNASLCVPRVDCKRIYGRDGVVTEDQASSFVAELAAYQSK